VLVYLFTLFIADDINDKLKYLTKNTNGKEALNSLTLHSVFELSTIIMVV